MFPRLLFQHGSSLPCQTTGFVNNSISLACFFKGASIVVWNRSAIRVMTLACFLIGAATAIVVWNVCYPSREHTSFFE